MNGIKSGLLAITFAIVVAGCGLQPVNPGPGARADDSEHQAETLARRGDFVGAARAYEALAAQSPADLRDRYLLRAARQHLQADNATKARELLQSVNASLPRNDFALRALVAGELALRAGQPKRALSELGRIPEPLPTDVQSDVLSLRARALFADLRPADAVGAALERGKLLATRDDQRANQRLIWEGLKTSAAGNADFTAPAGASDELRGWLALGGSAALVVRNPFTANEALADWRRRFPGHPAQGLLSEDVLPQLSSGMDYPTQMALILPLSGRQQASGMAVRDGFLAGLLQQPASSRPVVNVYDSAEMGAATAYRRAVADGAQFIIGPLTKEEVTAIANSGEVSVPTLALNQGIVTGAPPALLYQFSLDPEEEARQVAQRAMADGRVNGLALLPNNAWGRRVFDAFQSEFTALGGTLVDMRFYDPAERDFSEPITQMLLIDESQQRANALARTLGTRLEFEPRRRADAQFVFIAGQPVQGRSLRPALRFHLAQDLPVYATSDIFEPSAGNDDLDGVVFPDMPWVISPDAASGQLRDALNRHWPARARGRGRLYAFGFDACRIVPTLKAGRTGSQHAVAGMTGVLSVDEQGFIHRQLDWAQVTNGKAVPIGAATTAAR